MRKRCLTAFLMITMVVTSLTLASRTQSAKENSEVANLAMMLPDSDLIIAADMHKTLNIVAPTLLGQDAKKLENLKKLMKSFENSIGLNPYEINQAVIGMKFSEGDNQSIFSDFDFTAIIRTVNSNDSALLNWTLKMDAIENFEAEKKPSEKYIQQFRHFRYHKLSKDQIKTLEEEKKSLDDIKKLLDELESLLKNAPASAKTGRTYRESVQLHRAATELLNQNREILNLNTDSRKFSDETIRLQNRWTEIELDDKEYAEKLASVLNEAKTIYPEYKRKVENTIKIETLLNLFDFQVYEKLSKKRFGISQEPYSGTVKELLKKETEESREHLSDLSNVKSKQNAQLLAVQRNLQTIRDVLSIRLDSVKEAEEIETIKDEETRVEKKKTSLVSDLQKNAKITQVNGKKMISVDLNKLAFWNPSANEEKEAVADKNASAASSQTQPSGETPKPETKDEKKTPDTIEDDSSMPSPPMPKKPNPALIIASRSSDAPKSAGASSEKRTEPKKTENVAIGYLDDKTMVIGFEKGITNFLNRNTEYKNPKALEMVNSFQNPLVSFATNTKPFESFIKAYKTISSEPDKEPEKDKKETPVEKYIKDVTIFGSMEFEENDPATNDLVISLGFSKSKVEEVFTDEKVEEKESPVEIGSYQVSSKLFYDLLNTLKAYKASLSFKFEKKKIAALLEPAPPTPENYASEYHKPDSAALEKNVIRNMQNIEDVLTSRHFYEDLRKRLFSGAKH